MPSIKLLALLCATTTSVVGQTFISFPIVTLTTTRTDLGTTTIVGHHPPMNTHMRPIVTSTGPSNPGLGVTTSVDSRPWMDPPVVLKAEVTSSEVVSVSVSDSTSVKPSIMTGGVDPTTSGMPSGMTIQTSVPASASMTPSEPFSSVPESETSVIVITTSINSTVVVPAPTDAPGNKTVTNTVIANSTVLPTTVLTFTASPSANKTGHSGTANASAVPGSGAGRVAEIGVVGLLVAAAVFFLSA